MKSIKTVNLKANEIQAVEMPDLHCHVRNSGTATVFASRYSDVAPYTDGVLEIKSGDSKVVRNIFDYQTRQGFVYLFSESDTSVELESANDVNFFSRKIISGGESAGSVDTYNRSEINAMLSEKADNSDLKTVAKTGSYNDLSDKPEIPFVDVDKSYVDNALKEKADNSDVENVSNAVNTHISDISVHMTADEKEKLTGLENYDDLQVRINTSSIGLIRKNLLKNTAGTKTESGVLFTVNADGSVTAKRTETSESNSYYLINKISLKKGKYIFSGGNSDDRNIPYILIYTYKADNTYIGAISGNTVFEVTDETMKYGFNINYPLGNTKAVTFYPMLRYADVADDTYAPYVDDLQTQINKNDNDIAITQSSIGLSKKNLLKVTGTTQKVDDVTFTVNDDMSITVSGKNTSDTTAFYRITNSVSLPIGKTYKLSGCPTNNKDADGKAMAYWRVEKQALVVAMDTGDSKTFTTTTSTNPTMAQICVYAGADFTDNPITFYPMIRYSDVTDDTYEQYTPSLQEQINDILARLTALEG